jgi:hypothetical protein
MPHVLFKQCYLQFIKHIHPDHFSHFPQGEESLSCETLRSIRQGNSEFIQVLHPLYQCLYKLLETKDNAYSSLDWSNVSSFCRKEWCFAYRMNESPFYKQIDYSVPIIDRVKLAYTNHRHSYLRDTLSRVFLICFQCVPALSLSSYFFLKEFNGKNQFCDDTKLSHTLSRNNTKSISSSSLFKEMYESSSSPSCDHFGYFKKNNLGNLVRYSPLTSSSSSRPCKRNKIR